MKSKKKSNKRSGATLSPEQWANVTHEFGQVLALPANERAAYIENLGTVGKYIKRELKKLLAVEDEADSFLESSIGEKFLNTKPGLKPIPVFNPGDRVGDFKIIAILGSGAFAFVYLARQVSLNRLVALKVSRQINNEAKTLAHLDHPNIVKIYSQTTESKKKTCFISMQFVPGLTLEQVDHVFRLEVRGGFKNGRSLLELLSSSSIKEGGVDPSEVFERDRISDLDATDTILHLGVELCQALGYAHARGVFHLDIKPSNILISIFGRAMLTDFNISKTELVEGDRQAFGGTFGYMSPEQRAAFDRPHDTTLREVIDQRSDIYSLGVVLMEILKSHGEMGREVYHVIETATRPDPTLRYPTAEEFSRALSSCIELRKVKRRLPRKNQFLEYAERHPLAALTLVGAFPQIIGCIVGITYNQTQIVSHLNMVQQHEFNLINWIYNPVIYSIAMAIWFSQLLRLRPFFESSVDSPWSARSIRELRAKALSLPTVGFFVASLGWLPGMFLYPALLHISCGPLDIAMFAHFMLSFGVGWLIAMSYSYIAHQAVVLRVFYPQLWIGSNTIVAQARAELASTVKKVRRALVMTAIVPLIGAVLIVTVRESGSHFADGFKTLVTSLILMGGTGIYLAIELSQYISQTLFSFTEGDKRLNRDSSQPD